jgi:hypothetical protein
MIQLLCHDITTGEKALDNNEARNASIIAAVPTSVLVIKAVDYHKAMTRRARAHKKHLMEMVSQRFKYAAEWDLNKLQAFTGACVHACQCVCYVCVYVKIMP